jgi:hypothetical protein
MLKETPPHFAASWLQHKQAECIHYIMYFADNINQAGIQGMNTQYNVYVISWIYVYNIHCKSAERYLWKPQLQTAWISAYYVTRSIWAVGIPINSRAEVRRLQECNLRTSRARRHIQQTKDGASLCACQVPETNGGTNMTLTTPLKYSHTIILSRNTEVHLVFMCCFHFDTAMLTSYKPQTI